MFGAVSPGPDEGDAGDEGDDRGFSVTPMTAGIGLGRTDDAAGGDNFGSASGEVHRLRLRSERAEREARSWREEARTAKASRDKAAARHAEALAAARLAV